MNNESDTSIDPLIASTAARLSADNPTVRPADIYASLQAQLGDHDADAVMLAIRRVLQRSTGEG